MKQFLFQIFFLLVTSQISFSQSIHKVSVDVDESTCQLLSVTNPTLVKISKISIYPNPTKEGVFVNFDTPKIDVILYSISGIRLKNLTLTEDNSFINIEEYASGLYFLTLNNGIRTTTIKLIIE